MLNMPGSLRTSAVRWDVLDGTPIEAHHEDMMIELEFEDSVDALFLLMLLLTSEAWRAEAFRSTRLILGLRGAGRSEVVESMFVPLCLNMLHT